MAEDFLKEVVLEKQKSLKESKRRYPEDELRIKLEEPREWRSFKASISTPDKLNVIGEIKKASPSQGILRQDFNPVQLSRIYQNSGCAAISVLTEEKYFQGKIAYLNQVRKIVTLPILRKDFIFDIYQLYESKFFGADAVLLIAELLKNGELSRFLQTAKRLELDCLVEVETSEDLRYALAEGADIIGINSRNLHTLDVDVKSARALIKEVPPGVVVVAESGIKTNRQYLAYRKLKVNAILIGSAFMKAPDIREKIKDIIKEEAPVKKAAPKKRPGKGLEKGAKKSRKKKIVLRK